MKQTAVEWLEQKIDGVVNSMIQGNRIVVRNAIKKAKELEKQRIIDFTNSFIDKHTFGDYDGIVQRNKTIE